MKLILLSGGAGKRLWPLSNDARSKQFLRLLENNQGVFESMAQRVYRQLRNAGLDEHVLISTNATQRDSFQSQIAKDLHIVTEPQRRDTFAAIALACSYLNSELNIDRNEPIVVLPSDQYVDDSYFDTIRLIGDRVNQSNSELVLMGITPSGPSTKYGYIIPNSEIESGIYSVKEFKEKPTLEKAISYIQKDALWNGGVFGFKLGYVIDIIGNYLSATDYATVYENFEKLPKISFDYEVVEKTPKIEVIRYSNKWEDLGTWSSLCDELTKDNIGKAIQTKSCVNTKVVNELNIPILCSGTQDLIVVASYDGILVSSKKDTDNLKPYIETIATRPLYEERRWGVYKVLDMQTFENGKSQLTKQIVLNPGASISYQRHQCRDEVWTIVDGNGKFLLDGEVKTVGVGDVLDIKSGQKHAIKADSQLTMIEVQLGTELVEADIERFEWSWD